MEGKSVVKRIIFITLAYLCLTTTASLGQDSMEFYNLGLKSSLVCKKIEYFTRAIELNPLLAEAYQERAILYYFQRRLDKAIEDFTRVIELKPHWVNPCWRRGLAYLKKSQGDGFLAELSQLVHCLRKQDRLKSREYLECAIEDFNRAIKMNPQLANAYSYRAEAYRLMGMVDEAIADSIMAIHLRGDQQCIADAHATRAKIYWKLGQYELSEAEYLKSDNLNPDVYVFGFFVLSYSSDNASLEAVHRLGLIGIIVLIFVVVLRLGLPAPTKEIRFDHDDLPSGNESNLSE